MKTQFKPCVMASIALFAISFRWDVALADLGASVQAYQAHQVGLTSGVRVGTATSAGTNLPNIWARAWYRIECSEGHVKPPLAGAQQGSNNGFFGPTQISITSPLVYPTEFALPGWSQITPGTSFDCVNYYGGAAKTNVIPIGGGGSSFPIGGDDWSFESSFVFDVVKPGTARGGCIP